MPEKVRFGIRMDVPDTIQCQGCGREIPTATLRLFGRFWCRSCYRMMTLTRGTIRFRFLPRHRRLGAFATWFGVLSVGFFPLLAVLSFSFFANNWLACCAGGIPGAAVPLDTIAYGAREWAVSAAAGVVLSLVPGWAVWRMRRTNRDRQLVGGFLAVVMSGQRLALMEVARVFSLPSRITFSWPFTLCLVNGLLALLFVPFVRRISPGV